MLKALVNSTPNTSGARKPLYMVCVCTVFAAFAQVLLKIAAGRSMPAIHFGEPATLLVFLGAVAGNWPLLCGYALHAANALLLVFALRDGHLSILYPVYSLSYIWVNLLSLWFFHEQLNAWKVCGLMLILAGVALLGKVSSSD